MPSVPPRSRAKAPASLAFLLACFVGGCDSSRSSNESNVQGPPVDPATVPHDRDEMLRQQQKDVDDFKAKASGRRRP